MPIISLTGGTASEGNNIVFDVSLDETSLGDITVQYRAVRTGTAELSGNDLFNSADEIFTLTIPAGDDTATIQYNTQGVYSDDEWDENFTLELLNPTNATLAGGGPTLSASGVILDNDGGSNLALFVSDPVLVEGDNGSVEAEFEVRLSQASGSNITLDYQTVDGTAIAGVDYTAVADQLTFLAGETVKTVRVDVTGDTDIEAMETFSLVVEPSSAIAAGVSDSTGIATILDDDPSDVGQPVLTIEAVEASEGNNMNFAVTLSEPSLADVTFTYRAVRDGTVELSGNDLFNTADNVFTGTIAAGFTRVFIQYASQGVYSDDEFDENYTMEIANPTNAVLAGGEPVLTATGVILDNDGGSDLALFVSDPTILEGDSGTKQAVFEVRLSEPSSNTITLDFETADGSAVAGLDYTAKTGQVTFLPGQTVASVAVDILGDTDAETPENFSLVVTPTLAIAAGVSDSTGMAHIIDDDDGSGNGLPVISIESAVASEGNKVNFEVTLSEPSLADITVRYRAVQDGMAELSGNDLFNTADEYFTLTIPAGTTRIALGYTSQGVYSDDEWDENFTLELSNPTNAVLAGNGPVLTATGVILDNDGGSDRALFVSNPIIIEGDNGTKQAVFEVRMSEPSSSDLTMDFETADGTATAGEDYVATSGSVTFLAGQTVTSVFVDILGDTDVETQEVFSLVVTPSLAIASGVTESTGMALIMDDDDATGQGLPVVTVESGVAVEGNYLAFEVRLSEPSLGDVVIEFRAVADGTATLSNIDLFSTSDDTFSITIPAGETNGTIRYSTQGVYSDDEFDENFTLELFNPTNAVLAGGESTLTATGVILDNDGGNDRGLFVSDPTLTEGDDGATYAVFEVRISEPSDNEITLNYQTSDGTAEAGEDYVATSGQVTFLPGQTVTAVKVEVTGDTDEENAETFSLVVTPNLLIHNGTADNVGVATILNDDKDLMLAVSSQIVTEEAVQDTTMTFTLTIADGFTTPVTLDYQTVADSATEGADYTGVSGTVTFAAGETSKEITVDILHDDVIESTERFQLEVIEDAGTGIAASTFGLGRIADFDLDADNVVVGTAAGETIKTGNGDDKVNAIGGNDKVYGGSGADDLNGGAGADDIYGGNKGDKLYGAADRDELFGGNGNDKAYGGADRDTLFGNDGDDRLEGGAGNDKAYGGKGKDQLYGGDGTDGRFGGSGADKAYGGKGDDNIQGGTGNDTLEGGNGKDVLTGQAGSDKIKGGNGNDKMYGGAGGDILTGGGGVDKMEGGAGADRFVFNSTNDSGTTNATRDVILDFSRGQGDKIDLRGIDAKTGGGNQSFDFIAEDRFSGKKGELRYVEKGNDLIVQADTNGNGNANLTLLIEDLGGLRASDFIL